MAVFSLACQFSTQGESTYDQEVIAKQDFDKHMRALNNGKDFVNVSLMISCSTLREMLRQLEAKDVKK